MTILYYHDKLISQVAKSQPEVHLSKICYLRHFCTQLVS
nr:MAG TPA: hypothetical protein [Caudoviricetes sp.]